MGIGCFGGTDPPAPGPRPWCLGRKAAKATCSLYKLFWLRKGLGKLEQQLLERDARGLISM